jgi:hypothetical protein
LSLTRLKPIYLEDGQIVFSPVAQEIYFLLKVDKSENGKILLPLLQINWSGWVND